MLRLCSAKGRVIPRVEVPQTVPATPSPLPHRVRLALRTIRQIPPIFRAGQWWLARRRWLEIRKIRRNERQSIFRQSFVIEIPAGIFFPNDRKWFAPVPLPAEKPIAQFVIDRFLAETFGLEPIGDFPLRCNG